MLDRIMDLVETETLELRTQLHLSKEDLKISSDGIIDDEFLSGYTAEEQSKILSLEAYITERVRLITNEQIKSVCADISTGNIFLRGSGATGIYPLDDLDLSFYGPKEIYTPEQWPQTIIGIPVSWGNVPQEELADCMNTSLRMAASALEAIPVTPADKQVADIISSAKSAIKGEGKYYYLLFRQFEEQRLELPWKKSQNPPSEYKGRKEMPGGKRTIQRISWNLQILYPELSQTINPNVLLMRAYYEELVPFEIVTSAFRIMRMIKSNLYEPEAFNQSAQVLHNWYINSLIPDVNNCLKDHIPHRFLTDIHNAYNTQTSQNNFQEIINNAENQDKSYKQWLLLWVTSHNPSCPKEYLYKLWNKFLGRMAYRNVLRNLLRNPSFPIPYVSREETKYDPHLLECYDSIIKKFSE